MLAQFKPLAWKASLLATVVSMLAFTVALAASGDLDTTFDGDGLVTSFAVPANPARNDVASGLAIQANGKIVAAGYSYTSTALDDFAVLRYNADGSLDTTFSGDGRQITNFGGIDDAFVVAVQSNGKIVAAGQTCNSTGTICNLAVARYNPGGALDTTFSGDGKVITDFGGDDNGSYGGLAIQPNGKIVVAGYMWNGTDYDFAVYRYLSGGALDTTFSGDGKVNIGFGAGRQDLASDVVVQSDGKIVVSGYTGDANGDNNNFAIVRLNAGGSLDTTFSGDGKVTTDLGGNDFVNGVALQPDGKIVAAGEKDLTIAYIALARYNTDGSLDTTFNGSGKKVFSIIANRSAWVWDVLVQPNGKIVTMGSAFTVHASGNNFDFVLVRLNTGGAFDTTFSGDGKVTIDFGGGDFGIALGLQPLDGKYVLAGDASDGTQSDFALARVLP